MSKKNENINYIELLIEIGYWNIERILVIKCCIANHCITRWLNQFVIIEDIYLILYDKVAGRTQSGWLVSTLL